MSIVNIWTGSIRPFCNVLFVKTNDKYWLRARSRIRDTHRVSTVLVNYIGTTVSPALFIVRHRRKLLNEQLVAAAASSRFASRCRPPPSLPPQQPFVHLVVSALRLQAVPYKPGNCWYFLSLSLYPRECFLFLIAFYRSSFSSRYMSYISEASPLPCFRNIDFYIYKGIWIRWFFLSLFFPFSK